MSKVEIDKKALKQVRGFWLPATEEHLVPFLENGPQIYDGPSYQLHKLKHGLSLAPNRRRQAVDVGAHCGLWSRVLARCFSAVFAFEPVPLHRACFMLNVPDNNTTLYPYALGEEEGPVRLHTGPSSSGDTYVKPDGEHSAIMKRLDSFTELNAMDFLKIDCEGWEYHVLKSGEALIRDQKPVIVVEQKPNKGTNFGLSETAACELLESWGAKRRHVISGDYFYTW